jgi:hypothetical protein
MSEKPKHPGHYVDVAFPTLPPLPGVPALPSISLPTIKLPRLELPGLPTFGVGLLDTESPEFEAAMADMRTMIHGKVRAAVRMRDALEAEQEQRDAAELPAILAEAERVFEGK